MLVLVLLGFVAVAVPAYAAFSWIVSSTVIQLGTLFAEKQILYDRFRGLEALTREVSLAETLAGTQAIRDWAVDETDADKRRRAIAELEHYRQSFADKSYFFVIGASGNYYFNDASNAYAGDQYRYTVDPYNPRDGWYYNTAALGQGCHLNVDNDDKLRVTKVWMNCVIREGRKVLGILGTGIDLSSFIREVVNVPQVGVIAMFVDHNGAGALARIGFVHRPVADRLRAGQRLSQRDFPRQRFEPAETIVENLFFGKQGAQLDHRRIDDPGKCRIGRDRHGDKAEQYQHQHACPQARGNSPPQAVDFWRSINR